MAASQISAKVLRNKGVPIVVNKVEPVEAEDGVPAWRIVTGSDGETAVTETVYLRFDFNVIAELEDHFGGTQPWQDALAQGEGTSKMGGAIRDTIAIALGVPLRQAGVMLVIGTVVEYGVAIGLAWGLANGMDPTVAAKRLNEVLTAAKALQAEMGKAARTKVTESSTGDS